MSKSKIGRKVKDMFHEAIERAVDPGKCRYANDGKPQCVIGQFAALYAPKEFERMAAKERERGGSGIGIASDVAGMYEILPLTTKDLADNLQGCWDAPLYDDADETRLYMHFLVEAE